jgi:WD40 repeat protein
MASRVCLCIAAFAQGVVQTMFLLRLTSCVVVLIALPAKAPTQPREIAAVSPDGRIVAVADGANVVMAEAKTGKVLWKGSGHKAPVTALAFSPDGKLLASGSKDKTVYVWESPAGKVLWSVATPVAVTAMKFSVDAPSLVVIGTDGAQREFHAVTGKLVRVIPLAPK